MNIVLEDCVILTRLCSFKSAKKKTNLERKVKIPNGEQRPVLWRGRQPHLRLPEHVSEVMLVNSCTHCTSGIFPNYMEP